MRGKKNHSYFVFVKELRTYVYIIGTAFLAVFFPLQSLAQNNEFVELIVSSEESELGVGESTQILVVGKTETGALTDLHASESGTVYTIITGDASVTDGGLLTIISNQARHVGVKQFVAVVVTNGNLQAYHSIELLNVDSDNDLIVDSLEVEFGLNPENPSDALQDLDMDGLNNLQEIVIGTNPNLVDTDNDGVNDSQEIENRSDPLNSSERFRLNEDCEVTLLNRTSRVQSTGDFSLANIPVPIGSARARVVCTTSTETILGSSPFQFLTADGTTVFSDIKRVDDSSAIPISLQLSAENVVITVDSTETQITVSGELPNGDVRDYSTASSGTVYFSSNERLAVVSNEGVVRGISSGAVLITAVNEGVVSSKLINVNLSSDSDLDGLPDDFEQDNILNTGGANLASLTGTTASASSFTAGRSPEKVIDGEIQTSWFTAVGDAANNRSSPFIEVTLPVDGSVAQVRLVGNRRNPNGFDFFAGIFSAFDAAGNEIFNSGEVRLPAPNRDIAVPIDLDNVRRVRFTSTADESNTPGLSEFQLISRPGGAGLDPNNGDDANQDFDFDGLTNLEEFNLGTSIFLGDTDGDSISDAREVELGSNPLLADTDNDGLVDGSEVNRESDSDRDGIINLLDSDSDNDGIPDGPEVAIGLSPVNADSNGNGIPDGSEDGDVDGLPNIEEILENTDPSNADTDGDGALDGEEVVAGVDGFITDPLRSDTDGDGMPDGYESRFGLDPTDDSDAQIDSDDDGLSNLEESELGTDPFNADIAAPAVAQIDPVDGNTEVLVNSVVVVRFNEPVSGESVVSGSVAVSANATSVAGGLTLSDDMLSITFQPEDLLQGLTDHEVTVQGIRDLAGNTMTGVFESGFRTSEFVDIVSPEILLASPQNGQTDVPVNTPLVIEFSEPVDPATLTDENFSVSDNITGQVVVGEIQVNAEGGIASFVPENPFAVGRRFSVFLGSGITDRAGNPLVTNFLQFTTAFDVDSERLQLLSVSPLDTSVGVPVNALIQIQFDEPVNPINLARGFSVVANGLPVDGSIAFSDGNRRVTFTSESALPGDSQLMVSVSTTATDLVGNPLDNPMDFTFLTSSAGDVVRPSLAGVIPANGQAEVATNVSPIQLVFTEAISSPTVSESSVYLERVSGIFGRIEGRLTVSGAGQRVTFLPDQLLQANTDYRVRINGAVTDVSGNPYNGTSIPLRFTTGSGPLDEALMVVATSIGEGLTEISIRCGGRVTGIGCNGVCARHVGIG